MTNVAKAISATDSTLRPGMRRRLADAEPCDRHRPVPGDSAAQARVATRPTASAAAQPAARRRPRRTRRVCGIAPVVDAPTSPSASTRPMANRSQGRPRPVLGAGDAISASPDSRSFGADVPSRRSVSSRRDGGGDQPAQGAQQQRAGRNCQREPRRSDGVHPPRAKPVENRGAEQHSARHSDRPRRSRRATSPSTPSNRRTRDGVNPSAKSSPTSRTRCSSPSLKNRPLSSRPETTMKKEK